MQEFLLLMAEIRRFHQLRLVVFEFFPLFIGFHTSQVVQDFSHQQYFLAKTLQTLLLALMAQVTILWLRTVQFPLGERHGGMEGHVSKYSWDGTCSLHELNTSN